MRPSRIHAARYEASPRGALAWLTRVGQSREDVTVTGGRQAPAAQALDDRAERRAIIRYFGAEAALLGAPCQARGVMEAVEVLPTSRRAPDLST
jgi:hypothetical protein